MPVPSKRPHNYLKIIATDPTGKGKKEKIVPALYPNPMLRYYDPANTQISAAVFHVENGSLNIKPFPLKPKYHTDHEIDFEVPDIRETGQELIIIDLIITSPDLIITSPGTPPTQTIFIVDFSAQPKQNTTLVQIPTDLSLSVIMDYPILATFSSRSSGIPSEEAMDFYKQYHASKQMFKSYPSEVFGSEVFGVDVNLENYQIDWQHLGEQIIKNIGIYQAPPDLPVDYLELLTNKNQEELDRILQTHPQPITIAPPHEEETFDEIATYDKGGYTLVRLPAGVRLHMRSEDLILVTNKKSGPEILTLDKISDTLSQLPAKDAADWIPIVKEQAREMESRAAAMRILETILRAKTGKLEEKR